MATLRMEKVSKVYGQGHTAVRAVSEVDLKVAPGEIVLIMGPSGGGKTTLLSMAGAMLRPTEGRVFINGHEITRMRESQLPPLRRQEIGFVFQAFNLLSNLTALENVLVPMSLNGKNGLEAREKAEGLLRDLGLGDRMDHLPADLSGGEKQRVSIARALANDPKIILADEPTGNLDSQTGHEVTTLLCRIACDRNVSVVMVSHDQRIADVAHRVFWMEDGQLRPAPELERRGKVAPAPEASKEADSIGARAQAWDVMRSHPSMD